MNRAILLLTLGLSLAPVLCWAAEPKAEEAKVKGLTQLQPRRAWGEEFRQSAAEIRQRKNQVENVLPPQIRPKLNLSKQQEAKIAKAVAAMNESFAKEMRSIEREAFESDAEGPVYAIKRLPTLGPILEQCRTEICRDILNEDQAKLLRAEWIGMDAEEAARKADESRPVESLWLVGKDSKPPFPLGMQIHIENGKAVVRLREVTDTIPTAGPEAIQLPQNWDGESLMWGGEAQILLLHVARTAGQARCEKKVLLRCGEPNDRPTTHAFR